VRCKRFHMAHVSKFHFVQVIFDDSFSLSIFI
jgi:hypothetical protein